MRSKKEIIKQIEELKKRKDTLLNQGIYDPAKQCNKYIELLESILRMRTAHAEYYLNAKLDELKRYESSENMGMPLMILWLLKSSN